MISIKDSNAHANPPAMLDGARPVRNRSFRTYVGAIKDA
jgi:hypothetical protein